MPISKRFTFGVMLSCTAGVDGARSEHVMQHGRRHKRGRNFLAVNRTEAKTMSALWPFYHTTSQISSELEALAQTCPGMTLEHVTRNAEDGSEVTIDVVSIKKSGATPVNKNFVLYGEHARELISPESGLHLVKSLCGETSLKDHASKVLDDNEYKIVINGNPKSRKKVEQGDFCLRVNENGVDLNRNWDEEWAPDPASGIGSQTNPGPSAFSEVETGIFKSLVEAYRPNTFLTIHSGTRGMYMPWAYDQEHLATRNQPQMMEILKKLDADHCECPFGAAGREVGYSCPGTCLDWVYDKLQADYAFAFEIYTGNDYGSLKERWEEKIKEGPGSFLQLESHLANEHFKGFFEDHPSSFVQFRSRKTRFPEMSANDCMQQFNPTDEADYAKVIENWSGAYLDMADMIARNLKGGAGRNTSLPLAEVTPKPDAVDMPVVSTPSTAADVHKMSLLIDGDDSIASMSNALGN